MKINTHFDIYPVSFSILGGSNTEKGVASSEPLKHLDQPISAGVGSTRKFTSESNAKPVGRPHIFVKQLN